MVKSQAFSILCYIACEVSLSLCCRSCLNYEKYRDLLETKQDSFGQYLLPFSSECCMCSAIELTVLLSFCVGMNLVSYIKRNTQTGGL